MNWKFIIAILAIGLITFLLGWYCRDKAIIGHEKLDPMMIDSNSNNHSINFDKKISGKFVLKDAKCAGFNFISPSLITWTNEIDCGHPDTLKIRWIDNNTFYTQEIVRPNENCPPRISIYQVVSFKGHHLILRDIWTGWNHHSDEILEFTKQEAAD